jgi:hypothetical protein
MDKIISQNKSRLDFLENAVFSIRSNVDNLKTQLNNIIVDTDINIDKKQQPHAEFVRQKKGIYYGISSVNKYKNINNTFELDLNSIEYLDPIQNNVLFVGNEQIQIAGTKTKIYVDNYSKLNKNTNQLKNVDIINYFIEHDNDERKIDLSFATNLEELNIYTKYQPGFKKEIIVLPENCEAEIEISGNIPLHLITFETSNQTKIMYVDISNCNGDLLATDLTKFIENINNINATDYDATFYLSRTQLFSLNFVDTVDIINYNVIRPYVDDIIIDVKHIGNTDNIILLPSDKFQHVPSEQCPFNDYVLSDNDDYTKHICFDGNYSFINTSDNVKTIKKNDGKFINVLDDYIDGIIVGYNCNISIGNYIIDNDKMIKIKAIQYGNNTEMFCVMANFNSKINLYNVICENNYNNELKNIDNYIYNSFSEYQITTKLTPDEGTITNVIEKLSIITNTQQWCFANKDNNTINLWNGIYYQLYNEQLCSVFEGLKSNITEDYNSKINIYGGIYYNYALPIINNINNDLINIEIHYNDKNIILPENTKLQQIVFKYESHYYVFNHLIDISNGKLIEKWYSIFDESIHFKYTTYNIYVLHINDKEEYTNKLGDLINKVGDYTLIMEVD